MALPAPVDTAPSPSADAAAARTTGLLYLALGLTGMLGFLVVRPQLFEPGDAAATVANLAAHEGLAQAGIALELGAVLAQALAALWFFRLFRPVDSFVAGAIAVFGMVNAVAILGSAAFLASALDVSREPVGEGDSQLMYVVGENFWASGNLFFGLWLIPMGVAVLRSGWAPRALGNLLVVGGVLYVLSAFVVSAVADASAVVETVLVVPATVAEFWMIGWLLVTGLRGR